MYGIADIDNCYCSCEKVFRPDLEGKPIVVLSNNDGCVVARSNEAKAIGIKEGTPFFQLSKLFPDLEIYVFSSNYELYGELTGRIINIIKQEAPAYFRYSIDECFMYLNGIEENRLQQWGRQLHLRVKKEVGMPISIGIASNKTLAKIASRLAKRYAIYRHCCIIDSEDKRKKALEWCSVEDVWGIGRKYASRLKALGCVSAADFACHSKDWVRQTFNNINILRTWMELNGDDAVPNEQLAKKKSICTSRSFNGMVSDYDTLRTHLANYACRCAEKLRSQGTVATIVGVFLHTNAFREDLSQYWNFQEIQLITPSNSTTTIVKAATKVLDSIYIQGYKYKKAGVIVTGILPDSPIQQDFFDMGAEEREKLSRLDQAVDRINRINGSETVVVGSQQYSHKNTSDKESLATSEARKDSVKADVFANAIRHDFKSKNPTTRWSDIIKLK